MYPVIELSGDKYKIEYGGEEYFPHKGEIIRVTPAVGLDDLLALMRMSEVEGNETLHLLSDDACPILEKVIRGWTWTFEDEPVGKKDGNGSIYRPSAEDLRGLPVEELVWIISEFFEQRNQGEEKNQP
jgi:hypothetical protein